MSPSRTVATTAREARWNCRPESQAARYVDVQAFLGLRGKVGWPGTRSRRTSSRWWSCAARATPSTTWTPTSWPHSGGSSREESTWLDPLANQALRHGAPDFADYAEAFFAFAEGARHQSILSDLGEVTALRGRAALRAGDSLLEIAPRSTSLASEPRSASPR